MFFVYLIYNIKTKKFYIGLTNNIKRRIEEHKSGSSQYTKHECANWKLVYFETYLSKKDAAIRENKLKKHGSGLAELKKRIAYSMENFDDKTGAGKR